MRTIHRKIVSALLISSDHKILFGKKDPSKGGVYKDTWHLPGGGIDEGENEIEALQREVLEEVGIDISRYETNLIDSDGHGASEKILKDTGEKVWCEMDFLIFEVNIPEVSSNLVLQPTSDLVEFKWVNRDELISLNINIPSQELFKRLGWI